MQPLRPPPPPPPPAVLARATHSAEQRALLPCAAHLQRHTAMGGSLRRHKKHKPRIIKRQKKKRHVKSEVPQELRVNAAEIKEKLGVE